MFTRKLQDLCSHINEFESVEVAFTKRLSEVRQVPASEGFRHKVQEKFDLDFTLNTSTQFTREGFKWTNWMTDQRDFSGS